MRLLRERCGQGRSRDTSLARFRKPEWHRWAGELTRRRSQAVRLPRPLPHPPSHEAMLLSTRTHRRIAVDKPAVAGEEQSHGCADYHIVPPRASPPTATDDFYMSESRRVEVLPSSYFSKKRNGGEPSSRPHRATRARSREVRHKPGAERAARRLGPEPNRRVEGYWRKRGDGGRFR
jgi:hypothetical protein